MYIPALTCAFQLMFQTGTGIGGTKVAWRRFQMSDWAGY